MPPTDDDTTDRGDFKSAGRGVDGPSRRDLRRTDNKVEKVAEGLHEGELKHASLESKLLVFQAEQIAQDKSQSQALKRIEEAQKEEKEAAKESREITRKCLEGIDKKISGQEGRIASLEAKVSTPGCGGACSTPPAHAATPAGPVASPVHPLAAPQQPSIYQQMSPTQKGGAATLGVAGVPAIIFALWEVFAPYLGG